MHYIFLLALVLLSGCATSPISNQTYGTHISAKNNEVNFSLTPDYPYLNNLSSGLKLRATYQVKGQRVTEILATSRLQGGRAVFSMPEILSAIPDNQVCLQVEPMVPISTKQGKISILPVRRVSQNSGENAVAFRYPAWESNVGNHTLIKEKERELFRLESLLASGNLNASVSSSANCDNLRVKEVTYDEPHIKNKSGFNDEAKLVCTWKAQTFVKWIGSEKETDEFLSSFNMKNLTGILKNKGEEFKLDWNKYSPISRKLTDDPKRLGRQININKNLLISYAKYGDVNKGSKEESILDLINIVGQYVDLYDTCKQDVYVQLENKLAAWNARKDKQLHEDEELLKLVTAECQANIKNQQERNEKAKSLVFIIEQKKQEIKALRTYQEISIAQSPELNNLACSY